MSLFMIWAPGSFWKVFQLVWAIFEQLGAGPVTWGGLTAPQAVKWVVGSLTAWWGWSNRPGHGEQIFALCCIPVLHCCIGSGGVCFGSGGACICAGELFVVFELWFGGLRSLLDHGFVSDVSNHCHCLRGPRLVFFKWSCSLPFFGFRSLVEVSFYSFLFLSFSLWLQNLCVVSAIIKGEIEDHVWFEDRWMVASWCDEWLTTLCGLTLG
jgi:hypothetical protein